MKILSRVFLVLLAIFGAFVGIVFMIPEATVNVTFTYQRATEREDGTPLSLGDIKHTQLYCHGKLVAREDGADGDVSAELTIGYHVCHATHADNNYLTSHPSNPVTKLVES
jgi:hypothetical protein